MRDRLYVSTIDREAGKVARQYGLGIEIAEFCTAWNMDRELPAVEKTLEETLSGVSRRVLHGPFNELFPCAIDPKARQLAAFRFSQAAALAQAYGAWKLVLHGGFNPQMYYPQWYVEQSVLFWKDFLKTLPEGLTVCVENVLEPTPDMLLDILRGVDDLRLRLCLDVGHVNAYSKIPAKTWIEESGEYLSHLHIHNNDGTWDTHNTLYEGTLPIRELVDIAMRETETTATLELPKCEPSVKWLLEE